jgi:hypothetical protein
MNDHFFSFFMATANSGLKKKERSHLSVASPRSGGEMLSDELVFVSTEHPVPSVKILYFCLPFQWFYRFLLLHSDVWEFILYNEG